MTDTAQPLRARAAAQMHRQAGQLIRLAIAAALVAALVVLRPHLSAAALVDHHAALLDWRQANPIIAMSAFFVASVAIAAISVPGVIGLQLVAGYLFGLASGAALAAVAVTLGSTILFLSVRAGFGERALAHYGARAGHGMLGRVRTAFRQNELQALLLLRLVPTVPFFLSNALPAILGARLRNFVLTTAFGILPGTVIFVAIGTGLGDTLAAGKPPEIGQGALTLLAIPAVVVVVVAVLRWRSGFASRPPSTAPDGA